MSADRNRILIVLPSWLGDVVMATPALRRIRDALPGAYIGALARPGIDQLIDGTDLVDRIHVDRARGVMGPKRVADKLRPERYGTALLLTNSFSTALIARLAWIRRRIGYDRDGRGLLLTDRLAAPRRERPHEGFAPIPAIQYYLDASDVLLLDTPAPAPERARLELPVTASQEANADALLARAGVETDAPTLILNPGANNPAKRWPADRFASIANTLARAHGLTVLVNGSPAEAELTQSVLRSLAGDIRGVSLPEHGITIGTLKALLRRASLLVTNDTGPRHIGGAMGTPTVALFGPTDPRWTTLPEDLLPGGAAREAILVADPTLPIAEVADDHPNRCRIERIEASDVLAACEHLLNAGRGSPI